MPEELIVTADSAKPPSELRWRCPLQGCDLEVLYAEELEFHAAVTHPDWEARQVVLRGFRRQELQVVFRQVGDTADELEEDDPECE
jgi:hypothetical protein